MKITVSLSSVFKTREQEGFGLVIYNEQGRISVISGNKYSPANHSITDFVVTDETQRGKGYGNSLLREAMRRFPQDLGGQASSKSSVALMQKNGFRMFNKPNSTLEDAFEKLARDSSVYMVYKQKPFESESATHREQENIHQNTLDETGFWGRMGAGAIIQCTKTQRYLLAHRSHSVEQPHTWGIWGGALDEGETPIVGVVREIEEEVGAIAHSKPKLLYVFRSGDFSYYNYLVTVKDEFKPNLDWETQNFGWFDRTDFPTPLHFGIEALITNKAI
jgi:8-oxo-dGTP pyrophosphatase MutT (NUDIX family)